MESGVTGMNMMGPQFSSRSTLYLDVLSHCDVSSVTGEKVIQKRHCEKVVSENANSRYQRSAYRVQPPAGGATWWSMEMEGCSARWGGGAR